MVFVERVLGNGEITIQSINISPNPTTGSLTVISPSVIIDTIEIIDIQGRMIYSENLNTKNATLDITSLDAAMYFIKIYTPQGNSIKRIVKK